MTTHALHEGPPALLYDGCPRCSEHAERPDRLDDRSLAELLNLSAARTDNEARALTRISWAAGLVRRCSMVSPLAVKV